MDFDELKELTQKELKKLPPLPGGREYMVLVAHGWGRDRDAGKAFKVARSNGSYYRRGQNWAVIYDVPAGAEVNEMGGISWRDKGDKIAAVGKVPFQKF